MAASLTLARFFRFAHADDRRAAAKTSALCLALLSEIHDGGERLAALALNSYHSLAQQARDAFFNLLSTEFSPDPKEILEAGDAYRREATEANLRRLQLAVEPPRQELFRRLNMAPGGTRALVQMRAWLLKALEGHPHWEPVVADLTHLLSSWFNRGFLTLQQIDWRTPATVLEKLIQYEAVHQIQGWDDLRRRLARDRRCYGFFHAALPDEPLIFIEVALTRGMAAHVQPLLDPHSPVSDPDTADHAMFYSITNCQEGLRGISFGDFLIKRVVADLSKSFPRLHRFATVSPVPGFRRWLAESDARGLDAKLDEAFWFEKEDLSEELRRQLVPLCARYLLHAKLGEEPLDSVARFHLKNGACLERINWLGDTSTTGLERSAGMTVNYVYRLAEVERNHERYVRDRQGAASRNVRALAK